MVAFRRNQWSPSRRNRWPLSTGKRNSRTVGSTLPDSSIALLPLTLNRRNLNLLVEECARRGAAGRQTGRSPSGADRRSDSLGRGFGARLHPVQLVVYPAPSVDGVGLPCAAADISLGARRGAAGRAKSLDTACSRPSGCLGGPRMRRPGRSTCSRGRNAHRRRLARRSGRRRRAFGRRRRLLRHSFDVLP